MYPSATCSYHSILWFWDLSVRILLVSFLCCAEVHYVNTLQFNYLLSCQIRLFPRFSLCTTIWQWILCFLFLCIRVSLSTYLEYSFYFLDIANLLFTMVVSVYTTSRVLFLCILAKFVFLKLKKGLYFFCQFERVMLYLTLVLFCTSLIASKAEHHIWARHTYTNTYKPFGFLRLFALFLLTRSYFYIVGSKPL